MNHDWLENIDPTFPDKQYNCDAIGTYEPETKSVIAREPHDQTCRPPQPVSGYSAAYARMIYGGPKPPLAESSTECVWTYFGCNFYKQGCEGEEIAQRMHTSNYCPHCGKPIILQEPK